jgi:hypothetical protein
MLCAHLFKSGSRAEYAVWDWQQKLFWYPHRVEDLEYQHLLRALSALVKMKPFIGFDQIQQEAEKGGFPGAVVADEPKGLS